MAVTEQSYTGNGSTTNYSFTFPYLKSTDIAVQVDQVATTAWSLANATTVQFNSAPASGAKIKILRDTNVDNLTATFYAGSAIKSEDLNDNFTQNLYVTQEVNNRFFENTGLSTMIGNLNMGEGTSIVFEGATDDAYETTLQVTDPTADRTISLPNVSGNIVTTGDTATVTATMLASDSVDSDELVDGSIDATHIASNAVTTAKINADAVTGAKIADNAIDSEHYTDGSIDAAHIASSAVTTTKINADAVTGAKIADDAIDSEHIAADSIDAEHYAAGSVDTTALGADAVTGAKIADDSIDSEHYVDGSIDTAHIADLNVTTGKIAADAITGAKIADDAIDSEHYTDASIDTAHIADAQVTGAKIAGTTIEASNLASNAITTAKITDANVTTDKLAADSVTIAKIGCEQTTISDSDSHLPTSGAVVDYVAAQLAPIGGLEVIATEVAFPATASQPAAGVVISIADAGGVVFNGSGVSTTGRTTDGTPATVTINGAPSSLYSETLAAGVGMQVSSTGSGNTYNYHKILATESDVKQLSDDINDFNARYRIASSEPGSDNDEGDLLFDTTANKMKVYDGSSWGEVTSTGDFKFLVPVDVGTTTAATWDGSDTSFDLKEGTNSGSAASVTSVFQLIVSLNGVIQKPNSGSWSGSGEGFYLTDADTIRFATAPPSGSTAFIIQCGSAVSIPTPGDGTVSAAKIASGAVATAKLADDAVTSAKIADDAITSALIADDAVVTAAIADDAITSALIADDAVVTAAIADNAITNALMADDAVGVAELSATGTASSSTYLRGDNSWATVSTSDTLSFRNLMINGAMQIAQRGTSFADSTNEYTLDRWKFRNSSGTPAFTVTQSTESPDGFGNSLKVDCTTADTSPSAGQACRLITKLEGYDLQVLAKGTSGAQASVLSFYVKTNKTGVYTVMLYDNDNSRIWSGSYTVGDTNWNRYTLAIPADTTGAFGNDNNSSLEFYFGLSIGSDRTSGTLASSWASYAAANEHVGQVNLADSTSNEWHITGIQLEVGATATDFEHRSYGDELLRCSRYFYAITGDEYDLPGIPTYANNATTARAMVQVPVPMRTAPSYTGSATSMKVDSSDDSSSFNCNNLAISQPGTGNPCGFVLQYDAGGMTAGQAGMLEFTANSGFLQFSAEL